MSKKKREFEFALVIGGIPELTAEIEDKLYEAGCDDATIGIRDGLLYAYFARESDSLKNAILSAIRDVAKANVGAQLLSVDQCDLVFKSEIARRAKHSRQFVGQYISGVRGPGNFPPPEFHLEDKPMWRWSGVSKWLADQNLLGVEESQNAEIVATINSVLEFERHQAQNPDLIKEIIGGWAFPRPFGATGVKHMAMTSARKRR